MIDGPMAKFLSSAIAAVAAIMLALSVQAGTEQAAVPGATPIIGFPNSGAPAAQPAFLQGVVALHNFAFHTAAKEFRAAEKIDPGFALAYWGEAMCYAHLVWGDENVAAGHRVLRVERAAVDPSKITPREEAYLAAARALFGPGDRLARGAAFEAKMRALHQEYPGDFEAAAFYALALIRRGAQLTPAPVKKRLEAAAILTRLYKRNPRHPGVLHYLIHAYDDPVHARLALPYARAFEHVAMRFPHALHMPSHIYLRFGLWNDVARVNAKAYAVSLEPENAADGPDLHSLEWLHYARLQQGRLAEAAKLLQKMSGYAGKGNAAAARAATRMAARATLVARTWPQGRMPDGKPYLDLFLSYPNALYAAGIAAAKRGDYATVSRVADQIASLRQPALSAKLPLWARRLDEMTNALKGMRDWRRGKVEETRAHFAQAERANSAVDAGLADVDQSLPNPIKPVRELYGEALLGAGQAAAAAKQFAAVLKRYPRRPASLLGSARALAAGGDKEDATCRYAELAAIWRKADANVPGLAEVRREVAGAVGCPAGDAISRKRLAK